MNRQKLESSATLAALILLALTLFSGVIGIADGVFGWDLLSENWEQFALFVMLTEFMLLAACVMVSVMLNLSIIAQKISAAADRANNDSPTGPRA